MLKESVYGDQELHVEGPRPAPPHPNSHRPSSDRKSPASRRGQDKRGLYRSAINSHKNAISMPQLCHNYGILRPFCKNPVCPDPVWKPVRRESARPQADISRYLHYYLLLVVVVVEVAVAEARESLRAP